MSRKCIPRLLVSRSLDEGAEESSARRIYLALEALPDCRPDTAGWARFEANGSWFSAESAGDYTVGAALFDCSRRWTVLEILSVQP